MLELPQEVESVLAGFLCCEVATVAKDGMPLTWPAVPLWLPRRGQVVLSTSIGFAVKAANVRRDPRVSLLFSDATGSDLQAPGAVLVQGTAVASPRVETWTPDLDAHWQRVRAVQPASRWFASTAPARWFMDWHYMRLLIHVTPVRVLWWPDRSMLGQPRQWQESDVG